MRDERVQAVTFNMATMQSADDMAQPIDELRNLKVNDRFPLLFLDEFDSDITRYASLLPLLWDGELHIGHRDLKLGKAVIVLAGSNPDLPKAMVESATMRLTRKSAAMLPCPVSLWTFCRVLTEASLIYPSLIFAPRTVIGVPTRYV